MKILTLAEMRWVEEECARMGITPSILIDNAGKAIAEELRRILGSVSEKRILFLIGTGNNGGDGLVAARYLFNWGAKVDLYLFIQRPLDDINLIRGREQGITVTLVTEDKDLYKYDELLSEADVAIDAIFGIGVNRPLSGVFSETLLRLIQARKEKASLRVIALDVPTGLDADTGACDPACPYADDTITLAFPKLGLFNLPGAERAGKITVVDIGIPAHLVQEINRELMEAGDMKRLLPRRSPLGNKGTFGRILVIAGSRNYTGAAYLACSAAMRSGSGLVTLAIGGKPAPDPGGKADRGYLCIVTGGTPRRRLPGIG
ncbi:MAG: NAD(P)H-hydrate epimerase [Chloroflexota bacterium]